MLLKTSPAATRVAYRQLLRIPLRKRMVAVEAQVCVYSGWGSRKKNNWRPHTTQASLESAHLVKDVMTSGKLFSCSPEDTVDWALELLVQNRITGELSRIC